MQLRVPAILNIFLANNHIIALQSAVIFNWPMAVNGPQYHNDGPHYATTKQLCPVTTPGNTYYFNLILVLVSTILCQVFFGLIFLSNHCIHLLNSLAGCFGFLSPNVLTLLLNFLCHFPNSQIVCNVII